MQLTINLQIIVQKTWLGTYASIFAVNGLEIVTFEYFVLK